jgi:hypothetical protein
MSSSARSISLTQARQLELSLVPFGEDRNQRNKSTTTSTTSQIGIVLTKSEITASTAVWVTILKFSASSAIAPSRGLL